MAVATLTLSFAGRASGEAADVEIGADVARAQALVSATALEVRVVDMSLEGLGGHREIVKRLRLELDLESPGPVDLVSEPTLCLTDLATYRGEAYKPGTVCWGGPGPAISDGGSPDAASISGGANQYEIELDDATTACAFGPGTWLAELRLTPRLGAGPLPGSYTVAAEFEVSARSSSAMPRPSGMSTPVPDCLEPSL